MSAEVPLTLLCNGQPRNAFVATDRLLVDFVREDLGLTGTKLGCGTGDCGACTVMLDGEPVCSCLVYAVECDGRNVETVEGVSGSPEGEAVVAAFERENAVQCGICTPGFVVSITALLRSCADPGRHEIENALAGNLCRCTGYFPIVRAVHAAADALRGGDTGRETW